MVRNHYPIYKNIFSYRCPNTISSLWTACLSSQKPEVAWGSNSKKSLSFPFFKYTGKGASEWSAQLDSQVCHAKPGLKILPPLSYESYNFLYESLKKCSVEAFINKISALLWKKNLQVT